MGIKALRNERRKKNVNSNPGDETLGNTAKVIALAGNPNVGKSTVFNRMTGAKQHTGNWSGKTVSGAWGVSSHNGRYYRMVDIPGCYSLMAHSAEEEVARDFLCFGNVDGAWKKEDDRDERTEGENCIGRNGNVDAKSYVEKKMFDVKGCVDGVVVVCDATCLERNLPLVLQIMEANPRVAVCVNLLDEAKRKGIHLDLDLLQERLGVPVVGTAARNGKGIEGIYRAIEQITEGEAPPGCPVSYGVEIEGFLSILEPVVAELFPEYFAARWLSARLLDADESLLTSLETHLGRSPMRCGPVVDVLFEIRKRMEEMGWDKFTLEDHIAAAFVRKAEKICRGVVRYDKNRLAKEKRQAERKRYGEEERQAEEERYAGVGRYVEEERYAGAGRNVEEEWNVEEERYGEEVRQAEKQRYVEEERQAGAGRYVEEEGDAEEERYGEEVRHAEEERYAGVGRYDKKDRFLDRIFIGKCTGFLIMFLLLMGIFWITIEGANYPSQLLNRILFYGEKKLFEIFLWLNAPEWLTGLLVHGMYRVLAWVVSVMLPPMAIFFPLFTLLEDFGYLPRVAFNLDKCFQKCKTCGKQALTTCMGFGCNAAAVVGCRIIDSPRERLIAMLTNSFVPCNGRYPTMIAIISMFLIGGGIYASSDAGGISPLAESGLAGSMGSLAESILAAAMLAGVIVFGILMSLLVSRFLSATLLKGMPSSFTLELPPYRRPQIGRVILRSILDRTLFVLGRAVVAAAPAGMLIWIMANVTIQDVSLLAHCSGFLDPLGYLLGMDGVILMGFILGFPANEIVMPIILMAYMAGGTLTEVGDLSLMRGLLIDNGWTWVTAVSTILFSLMHWPCATTCLTIRKESGSRKWMWAAMLIPTLSGILVCFIFATVARIWA